ncbi:hypothetical protein Pcinc_002881 [Petrolisthes cinctipes]|uniref:MADF domain-containing protein n=1 Tax=Petrolisthes cinctipes TaxID=88211 RepID=A0AAE1GK30_PETCI|nr:hypothetical protein Pcinc_012325 [Petrolisthes cinctipes]KAK3893326.1 hypothetical protein Pcinc_002881 [Petrolisthes cinctipes]
MASRTSAMEKSCHWERKETLLLIQLYRQNPCLWNVKADVYKDRNKRVSAINKITAELQKSGVSASASEVKKKIESIRCQYRRELRKQEKSKKSGAGADDIYTPTLWCFNDLCFLNDGDNMRDSVSNLDSQVVHVSEEVSDHEIFNDPALQQTDDSPPHTTPTADTSVPSTSRDSVRPATPEPSRIQPQMTRGRKRSLITDERREVLQEALHQLQRLSQSEEDNDNDGAFGGVVTNDLRQMNEQNKIIAQKLISEVLFLGKLGKLSFSSMIVE